MSARKGADEVVVRSEPPRISLLAAADLIDVGPEATCAIILDLAQRGVVRILSLGSAVGVRFVSVEGTTEAERDVLDAMVGPRRELAADGGLETPVLWLDESRAVLDRAVARAVSAAARDNVKDGYRHSGLLAALRSGVRGPLTRRGEWMLACLKGFRLHLELEPTDDRLLPWAVLLGVERNALSRLRPPVPERGIASAIRWG